MIISYYTGFLHISEWSTVNKQTLGTKKNSKKLQSTTNNFVNTVSSIETPVQQRITTTVSCRTVKNVFKTLNTKSKRYYNNSTLVLYYT